MVGAIIGGAVSIAGGLFGASAAKKRAASASKERRRLTNKLNSLEKNRQAIINPYDGVSDLSGMELQKCK